MIKINLLPHEKPPDRKVYYQIIGSLIVIIITIIVIGFFTYYYNSQIAKKDDEYKRKKRTVEQLQVIITQVSEFEKDRDSLKSKLNIINRLRSDQQAPVTLLDELSKSLPDHVWINFIQNVREKITLRGYSLSLTSIGDFITALENSPHFTVVQFIHSRLVMMGGKEVYEFELNFNCTAFSVEVKETKK